MEYDNVTAIDTNVIKAQKGLHYALINFKNQPITKFEFRKIEGAYFNLYAALKSDRKTYVIINKDGKEAFPTTFKFASSFDENGLARVTDWDNASYFININGEKVFEMKYKWSFSSNKNYIPVFNKENKIGILDTEGKLIYPLGTFQEVKTSSEGELLLKKKTDWYILKK